MRSARGAWLFFSFFVAGFTAARVSSPSVPCSSCSSADRLTPLVGAGVANGGLADCVLEIVGEDSGFELTSLELMLLLTVGVKNVAAFEV